MTAVREACEIAVVLSLLYTRYYHYDLKRVPKMIATTIRQVYLLRVKLTGPPPIYIRHTTSVRADAELWGHKL